MKIPKFVELPDYTITVRQFSEETANKMMGASVYAEWDVDEKEIHLRRNRKGKDKREDFVHEMEHAIVDWKDYFLGKAER